MKNRNAFHHVLTFVTLLTLLLPTTLSSARGTVQPAASQASSSTASGPANSPWPMYQHDAQRTSRSPYVGPSQPYLKWHYSISPSSGSSPSIAPDGTIYVGGIDEQFHAIRPDGTPKWMYGVPSRIGGSPAIADDGTVYIGHEDYSTGSLMAFNPDGSLEWSYPARGVRSSPAIAPDGTIYVGASNARLYAINPDGSLKWEYQPGFKESYSSPAIGVDATIYIAGCKERNIHAVNPDGTTKWTYPIGTTGDTISSPTIDGNGTIYIGGSDNKLYALNPDGTLKWSYPAGDLHNLQQSAAIGPSGTVYVITTEGTLYAFTPAGDVKWTYSSGAGEIKTTPTVDANETIYFGARNGKVYAINPDGSEKWTFQTPADVLGSTIAINSDGTLYVSGSEGVYAIGESGAPDTGTISGKITSASSGIGLSGATVTADGYSTTTASDGTYSMNVPAGTYAVKASPGTAGNYYSNQLTGVNVTAGATTIVDLKLTAISSDTVDTLIVTNFQRMKDIGFGATDVDSLEAKLNELKDTDPNETNMTAVIVDLSPGSAPIDITNTYTAWNSDEGDIALTNDLVREIDEYIEEIKSTQYPNLQYAIIVGSHEVIPMAARPVDAGTIEQLLVSDERDWVDGHPEWGYLHDLCYGDALDLSGRYLTDSLYGDTKSTVLGWDVEQLTPELAVGRLVETPGQIITVTNAYLNGTSGRVGEIRTDDLSVIAPEDALNDGHAAWSHLSKLGNTVTRLINCYFGAEEVRDVMILAHDIVYLTAHGDYNHVMTNVPGRNFWAGTIHYEGDTDHIPTLKGAVILMNSCHGGVNIGNNLAISPRAESTIGHEFPEDLAAKGVIAYIANTGYTLGSDSNCSQDQPIEYSEALFNYMLEYLAENAGASIGQAFVNAKNRYRHQIWFSNNDRRIMAVATLYGIPNARIRTDSDGEGTSMHLSSPTYSVRTSPAISCGLVPLDTESILSAKVTLEIQDYSLDTSTGLVEIPEATQMAVFGKPILPSISLEKVLPYGSSVSNVSWLSAESSYIDHQHQVSIGNVASSEGAVTGVFTETGFYPVSLFKSYSVTTLGGGGAKVGLDVMPVQYNHETGIVRIWRKLAFEIEYSVATSVDTDGDGLPDYWEQNYGLDPFNDSGDSGANADIDSDGLANFQEYSYSTNPYLYDTDGDGANDGLEVAFGTDPNNYFSKVYLIYLPTVLRSC